MCCFELESKGTEVHAHATVLHALHPKKLTWAAFQGPDQALTVRLVGGLLVATWTAGQIYARSCLGTADDDGDTAKTRFA